MPECVPTMASSTASLVVRTAMALRVSQKELGARFGVSHRTAHRWTGGRSHPDSNQLRQMAIAVHPVDPDLAASIAHHAGTTMEALLPPPPPVPAREEVVTPAVPPGPPPRAFPPVALLVDSILVAASDAAEVQGTTDLERPLLRAVLAAAFARAKGLGLTVEEVEGALGVGTRVAGNRK